MERSEVKSAVPGPVPAGAAAKPPPHTGVLRADIKFFPPGEHGDYAMIFDPIPETYFKLSVRTASILRMLDHDYELPAFQKRVNDVGIDADAEELTQILAFLHSSNLMVPDYGVLNARAAKYRAMKEGTMFQRLLGMYLFFRLPPIHPDRFFTFFMPTVRFFFNRITLLVILIASLTGYVLMLRQWNEVYAMFVNSLSWAGLVKYFWALLVTKTLHELSHGFTAKNYGIRIRSMGVSFIVFYPRLYVDLTDSWRLSRMKRLACDGAGIASELIFGGLAALVWAYSAPGPLRSTMFYLVTVSALGTVLANGNPFIRYDGYYLLCDAMNVENLMQRSTEYMKSVNRLIFFGFGRMPDSEDVSGLTLYLFGLGSFVYKFFLYTSIILILYFQFTKPVAIILMTLEAYTMLIMPFMMEMKIIAHYRRNLKMLRTGITLLLIAGAVSLLFIPLPWSFALPCEIVPESSRFVTVPESAFSASKVENVIRPVKKGEVILECRNNFLEFNIERYHSLVKQNQAELELVRSDSITIGQTPIVFEKLKTNMISLSEMQRRSKRLNICAECDGIFVPDFKEISPGRWLEKGMVLGNIVSENNIVYAYAQDREVNKINPGDRATLYLRNELEPYKGKVESINPVAVKFRGSTLVQLFGGTIPCYPNKAGKEFSPVNVLYCVTLKLDHNISLRAGRTGTAYVEQNYRLSQVIYRQLLHVFFREFSF